MKTSKKQAEDNPSPNDILQLAKGVLKKQTFIEQSQRN